MNWRRTAARLSATDSTKLEHVRLFLEETLGEKVSESTAVRACIAAGFCALETKESILLEAMEK